MLMLEYLVHCNKYPQCILESVQALARVEHGPAAGRIVAARQGDLLVTSFHPEVTGDHRVHQSFVDIVRQHTATPVRATPDQRQDQRERS